MMIVLDMNVLMTGAEVGQVIGNPVSYDKAVQSGSVSAGSGKPAEPKAAAPPPQRPTPAANGTEN